MIDAGRNFDDPGLADGLAHIDCLARMGSVDGNWIEPPLRPRRYGRAIFALAAGWLAIFAGVFALWGLG